MIHIMRIDEMAIRSKDRIDAAVKNRDYENSTEYARIKINEALGKLKAKIKEFPTKDAIDAIDTYNYLNEKDIRDRVYDTKDVDKYDVYFINTKDAQNSFTRNGYITILSDKSGYVELLADKADLIVSNVPMSDGANTSRLYLGYDKTLKDIVMWVDDGWAGREYGDYTLDSFIYRCEAFEETEDAYYDSVEEEVFFVDMCGRDYEFSRIYQAIIDAMDALQVFFKEFFEKVDRME